MSEDNLDGQEYYSTIEKKILSKKATLKVYNDANNLLFSEEITLGDIPAI